MTSENILAWIFVFQKNLFSYAVVYNKLIKYAFVNKDEKFMFFCLPVPARIWLLQLAFLWTRWFTANWIIVSHSSHCYNLFFVFKLGCSCSWPFVLPYALFDQCVGFYLNPQGTEKCRQSVHNWHIYGMWSSHPWMWSNSLFRLPFMPFDNIL